MEIVFATSNDTRKLSGPLQSRFFVVELEPYTYQQFYEITLRLLNSHAKVAPTIADAIWNTSKNVKACLRIGKLARSEEDVNFLLDILRSKATFNLDPLWPVTKVKKDNNFKRAFSNPNIIEEPYSRMKLKIISISSIPVRVKTITYFSRH